jgi:hypothetical protein
MQFFSFVNEKTSEDIWNLCVENKKIHQKTSETTA